MSASFLDIQFDLYQTAPEDLQDCEPPYNEYDSLEEKFSQTQKAYNKAKRVDGRIPQLINAYFLGMLLEKEVDTPLQRSYYARQLTQHLYIVSTRLYDIFELLGTKQIQRTLRTNVTMIRNLSAAEYRLLVDQALFIFHQR